MYVFVFRGFRGEAPNNSFVLPPGCREFVVGRQSCDYCLADPSISRKHSTIRLNEVNTLTVSDHSKFGTFVNGWKLSPNQTSILQLGDSIQFGNHQIRFNVSKEPLKVCTSNLPRYERNLFKEFCSKNDIEIQNDVEESTHLLVMSNITATLKVFASLMLSRLIVTPSFFLGNKSPLGEGKIYDCEPPIVEPLVNKSLCNLRISPFRTKMFKDVSFLFLDESHFSRMRRVFHFGGANAILYPHLSVQEKQTILNDLRSYIVLVQTENILSQSDFVAVQAKMNDLRMRPITDCEFGLSVFYCNKIDYCNPLNSVPKELDFLSTQALQIKETVASETVSQVTQMKQFSSGAPISSHDTLAETFDHSAVRSQVNIKSIGASFSQSKQTLARNYDDNQIGDSLSNYLVKSKQQTRKEPLLPSRKVTNTSRFEESEIIENSVMKSQHLNEHATSAKKLSESNHYHSPLPRRIYNNQESCKRSFGVLCKETISSEVPTNGSAEKLSACHEAPAKVARHEPHNDIELKAEPTEASFNMWNDDLRDSNIPDSNSEYERYDQIPCSSRICGISNFVSELGGRNKVNESGKGWNRKMGHSVGVISVHSEIKEEPSEISNLVMKNPEEVPTSYETSSLMQASFTNLTFIARKQVSRSIGGRTVQNVGLQNFKKFRKVLPVIDGKQMTSADFVPSGNTGPLIRIRSQCETER